MFGIVGKIFKRNKPHPEDNRDVYRLLDFDQVKYHFNSVRPDDEYVEDTYLIDKIKNGIKPERKNIFILEDDCEIVKIVTTDFKNYLKSVGRENEYNIIPLCSKTVGFDMLSIIAKYPEIKIDGLIADIVFGGNEKINGKKIIIDAVDLVILMTTVNPNIKYALFTGTAFSENNENGSRIAMKYEKYFGTSIMSVTFMKDVNVIFDESMFMRVL